MVAALSEHFLFLAAPDSAAAGLAGLARPVGFVGHIVAIVLAIMEKLRESE